MLGKIGFLKLEREINSVVDKLYSYQYKNKSLFEALSMFSHLGEAKGLLYSPSVCAFVKVTPEGKVFDSEGELSNQVLSSIFEARVFNQDVEMRWLHNKNLLGQLVLISEEPVHSAKDNLLETISLVDSIEQKYLLWGEVEETQNGWTYLKTSRIGKIVAPSPKTLKQEKRLALKTKEYLQEKDYGNVVVIEERLIDLEGTNG